MANGPGLSWGAGVANSTGQGELTNAASLSTATPEAKVCHSENESCQTAPVATEVPPAAAPDAKVGAIGAQSLPAKTPGPPEFHLVDDSHIGFEQALTIMSVSTETTVGGQAAPPVATPAVPAASAGAASAAPATAAGTSGGSGGGSGGGGGSGHDDGGRGNASGSTAAPSTSLLFLEKGSSLVEHVSREVIRKLRLAASAGSAEDRHVVCEELFADITCPLDASARAALLGPVVQPAGGAGVAAGAGAAPFPGGFGGDAGGGGGGRGSAGRGRLYYEVLAVYYATRGAADSTRALLHLCQLLWDTPWVAPIYALLLHRFLLLPRDVGDGGNVASSTSPGAAAPTSAPGSGAGGGGFTDAGRVPYTATSSYADQRVKHLNVLAHGARQLLLGDVHSGLSRFQPLWAFLGLEVAGLGPRQQLPPPLAGTPSLPPVANIDAVPAAARPWLLAVTAAFLPYYCLDEQVSEMARRFPPPVPVTAEGAAAAATPAMGAGGGGAGGMAAAMAGFDFLIVEVTDVLGRINSEAGLLKYLRALRALARPPPMAEPEPPAAVPSPQQEQEQAEEVGLAAAAADSGGDGTGGGVSGGDAGYFGGGRRQRGSRRVGVRAPRPPPPPHPLAGLPTITKLRLQNELYSLTSGGGPRYAPPEVRKAAFAALDALFPGGRSLRWFVRWASRTLHLEWLEGDSSADDPWAGSSGGGGGWLSWVYWHVHWWTALYGRALLAAFQLLYGIVVWRPFHRGPDAAGDPGVRGASVSTGGAMAAAAVPVERRVATSSTSEGSEGLGGVRTSGGAAVAAGLGGNVAGAASDRARAAWWQQDKLRQRRPEQQQHQ